MHGSVHSFCSCTHACIHSFQLKKDKKSLRRILRGYQLTTRFTNQQSKMRVDASTQIETLTECQYCTLVHDQLVVVLRGFSIQSDESCPNLSDDAFSPQLFPRQVQVFQKPKAAGASAGAVRGSGRGASFPPRGVVHTLAAWLEDHQQASWWTDTHE